MCRFAKTTASSRAPSQNETPGLRLKSFRITAYINEIRTQRRPQARGYSKLACNREADSNKRGDSKAGSSHSHNCSSHADSSRSCSTRDDGVCRPPGQGLPTMRMLKQSRASSEDMISSSYGSSYDFPCHENDTRVSVRAQGVFFASIIEPFERIKQTRTTLEQLLPNASISAGRGKDSLPTVTGPAGNSECGLTHHTDSPVKLQISARSLPLLRRAGVGF
jgi:hypothetical protein